jgi:hypothetical protein
MQPLIDADVLRYEIGFAAEAGWQQAGFPPFDYVAELLDNKINNMCAIINATQSPILFLTGKTNFRNNIAKRTPYKQRASNKPWHYKNITAYINAKYTTRIQEGLEADDLMAIECTDRPADTIICTRDKDLRSVCGWHYGWELGNQPSFGPRLVTELGEITLSNDRKSIKGTGLLFFYAQCLTGDPVDTVPGLVGCGAVKAFDLLKGSETKEQALERVIEAYKAVYGDAYRGELLEQGRLLWMTRKLYPDGSPVLWDF